MRRSVIFGAFGLLVAVTVSVIGNRQGTPDQATSSSPTGLGEVLADGFSPPASPPEVQVAVGPRFPSTLSSSPTADEVQSKLWFNDATWWGVLIESSTAEMHLYRLDAESQSWVDTGMLIDERSDARADVLWDGVHLYIASGGDTSTAADHVRVMRYSYDPETGTYALDQGFPVQLSDIGVRSLMIAKDTAGVAWVSYITAGQIWISSTGANDASWGAPFPLPVAGTSVGPGVAVLVTHGPRMGLVWTNQAEGAVYFTSHADGEAPGAWDPTTTILQGTQQADNHITARSLDGPDGPSLFVVVKTSLDVLPDRQPTDPQMLLLELRPEGQWRSHVFGRLEDRHSRPLLLLDEAARELYVFAVSPFGSGSVYYKRASADLIDFRPGKGIPFLQMSDRPDITSPTSTKQNLNAASGMVVMAADLDSEHYVHGVLPLPGQPSP